jgi:WD40 repeat protein
MECTCHPGYHGDICAACSAGYFLSAGVEGAKDAVCGALVPQVHLFDIRKPSAPLAVAPGHGKAVSYVRFLPGGRLVSASTDGTLRVWGVAALAAAGAGGAAAYEAACEVVLRGHANERNFIGLSTSPDGYIACGSETNEVVAYYRSLPPPVARYAFGRRRRGLGPGDGDAGGGSGDHHFVSSVCWSKRHGTLLAGNSAGHIKVLQLV